MPMFRAAALTALLSLTCAGVAVAAEPIQLTLKDHRFTPDSVKVPSGARIKITITNKDATPAEFESSAMKVEKVIVAGGTVSVMVGPLKPGAYAFVDEYNESVAKGTLTAVENLASE